MISKYSKYTSDGSLLICLMAIGLAFIIMVTSGTPIDRCLLHLAS